MAEEKPITSASADNTGTTLRNFLVLIGGLMLGHQLISQEFYNQYIREIPTIVALLLIIGPWLQSMWSKWQKRHYTEAIVQKALDAEPGTTKAEIVAVVPPPPTIVEKITGSGKTALPNG